MLSQSEVHRIKFKAAMDQSNSSCVVRKSVLKGAGEHMLSVGETAPKRKSGWNSTKYSNARLF